MITLEICIDSVEGALASQRGGAQRVELCGNLVEGGTTPTAGMMAVVRRNLSIQMNTIIRPRGGDFLYSDLEFEVMQHDITTAKELGADGVVIGLLNADGTVDVERARQLIALARPLNVTFHRAFDMTCDPFAALEALIELGVDRVLTTGQQATARQGWSLITQLVERANNRIIVMPGGIDEDAARPLLPNSGIREIHWAARGTTSSRMQHRNLQSMMGGPAPVDEYSWGETDGARVKAIREVLSIFD